MPLPFQTPEAFYGSLQFLFRLGLPERGCIADGLVFSSRSWHRPVSGEHCAYGPAEKYLPVAFLTLDAIQQKGEWHWPTLALTLALRCDRNSTAKMPHPLRYMLHARRDRHTHRLSGLQTIRQSLRSTC